MADLPEPTRSKNPFANLDPIHHKIAAAVVAVVVVIAAIVVFSGSTDDEEDTGAVETGAADGPSAETTAPIIVGEVSTSIDPDSGETFTDDVDNGPVAEEDAPAVAPGDKGVRLQPRPEPKPDAGVLPPDGSPPGPAIPYESSRTGTTDLVFILVIGSDARPGQNVARTRADSIHVIAVNPARGQGTIVGIPRDSFVEVPGHGRQKINSALVTGGPQLLAQTVADLTGFPIDYYVLTGFEGLIAMTDALGTIDVFVERRMNDRNSGARFEPGWHAFHGDEALAFTRNRKDTALGDFSRSENHGVLLLATLAKFRAEIGTEDGTRRWLSFFTQHVQLDLGADALFDLATLARRLDPGSFDNVVASGTVGRSPGGQSVVFLDDDAQAMFDDVAPDGVIGNGRTPSPPPETTTTTTTTAPPPTTAPPLLSPTTTTSTTTTTEPGGTSTTTTTEPGLLPVG